MACGCDDWAAPCCDVTEWNSECAYKGACASWPSIDEVLACDTGKSIPEGEMLVDERRMATEYLYEATCGKFPGICKTTVMPRLEPERCYCSHRTRLKSDYSASCGEMCEVILSPTPVADVQQVWINGREMYSGFEVHDSCRLVRTDGACWPTCDCSTQPYDAGTFSVTYLYGQEPPLMARRAAAILAFEIYQLCACGKCSIGGVVEVASGKKPGDLGTGFRIGHPVIDMFISQFGCQDEKYLTGVWSPEVENTSPRKVTSNA